MSEAENGKYNKSKTRKQANKPKQVDTHHCFLNKRTPTTENKRTPTGHENKWTPTTVFPPLFNETSETSGHPPLFWRIARIN